MLVGKDQKEGVSELILVQHTLQLLTSLHHTVAIVAIDDENDALGVLEVMPPQRSDLVLSSDIPHGELNVLVFHGLNVEALSIVTVSQGFSCRRYRAGRTTNCGYGRDDFAQLQLVEDGGLAGRIETDHQDAHFLLPPELIEQFRERETHDCGRVKVGGEGGGCSGCRVGRTEVQALDDTRSAHIPFRKIDNE